MRYLTSTLTFIIVDDGGARFVDPQMTGNNLGNSADAKNSAKNVIWPIALPSANAGPGARTASCKFTDKLNNLKGGLLICRVTSSPTTVMAVVQPLLASFSARREVVKTINHTAHNEAKPLNMVKHKDRLSPVSITIFSPTDGEIIRSNSSVLDVIINVYVDPLMNQATEGLERKVILDGKQVASGIGSTFQLLEVGRGAHSLVVAPHRGQEQIQ